MQRPLPLLHAHGTRTTPSQTEQSCHNESIPLHSYSYYTTKLRTMRSTAAATSIALVALGAYAALALRLPVEPWSAVLIVALLGAIFWAAVATMGVCGRFPFGTLANPA